MCHRSRAKRSWDPLLVCKTEERGQGDFLYDDDDRDDDDNDDIVVTNCDYDQYDDGHKATL